MSGIRVAYDKDSIRIVIPLAPIAKGRPRARIVKASLRKNDYVSIYTPPETFKAAQQIELIIRSIMRQHPDYPKFGKKEPLGFRCLCVFERPKSYKKTDQREWKVTKPDRDNVEKLIMDAISMSGLWDDDKQVAGGAGTDKVWGASAFCV